MPKEIFINNMLFLHSVIMLLMQESLVMGWMSPNIASFESENSTIKMTDQEISWLPSFYSIGCFFGANLVVICMTYLGNKNTILLTLVLMNMQWLCLISANNFHSSVWIYWIFTGTSGISSIMALTFSFYLSETTSPKIRGTVIAAAMYCSQLGLFISAYLETHFDKKITPFIYLTTCVIGLSIFIYLLDSPYHLVKKHKTDKAKSSIAFYFPDLQINHKLSEIEIFLQMNVSENLRSKLIEFTKDPHRKSLILILLIFTLPIMSGILVISTYMQSIAEISRSSSLVAAKDVPIYVHSISIGVVLFSSKLIDKIGRRQLYAISSIGSSVSMLGLGVHFYLLETIYDEKYLQWLPITCLTFYQISYGLGFMVVPPAVLSEIFPNNLKGLAAYFTKLTVSISGFLTVKLFEPMVHFMGYSCVFFIYATISVSSLLVVKFVLKETTQKSFLEIQNEMHREKSEKTTKSNSPKQDILKA